MRYIGTNFMAIDSTLYLHNLIRSGQADCYCPESTKKETVVTHLPGCRWQETIELIYILERADEAIKLGGPLDGTPSEE